MGLDNGRLCSDQRDSPKTFKKIHEADNMTKAAERDTRIKKKEIRYEWQAIDYYNRDLKHAKGRKLRKALKHNRDDEEEHIQLLNKT